MRTFLPVGYGIMRSSTTFASLVLFVLCCNYGCNAEGTSTEIQILGLSSCGDVVDPYEFNFDLREDDDGKALYATYKFPEDLSDDFTFTLHIDKLEGDTWEEDYMVLEDAELCTYIQRYAGGAYTKAAKQSDPEMSEDCPITAGSYKLDNFRLSSDDASPPKALQGHFMVKATFYDPDKEYIFCEAIEAILE